MCPSSGLWGGVLGLWIQVYHPESTLVRRAPALTLYKRMLLYLSPHTCTLCSMSSLDPSVVGLAPLCTCWRKDTITRFCASHTCVTESHDRRRACLFPLLVHQPFGAECRSRFQQPIRGHPPKNSSAQIPTLEQQLWAHRWCFCAAHLLLPLSPLRTTRPCLSTVQILKYIRSAYPHWLRPHPAACPRNNFEERPWIQVVPCLLTCLEWYCYLHILCLLRQLFFAADS